MQTVVSCLNPYCNGRWSRTNVTIDGLDGVRSLNPCCDGRWSRTQADGSTSTSRYLVLILVVMEDGLVPLHNTSKVSTQQSLNPCCDGRWSRTCCLVLQSHLLESVLILVVMEDGLVR